MKNAVNNYLNELKNCLDRLSRDEIENFINLLLKTKDAGKRIYIMGNGGSASTASHFCCDFNKGIGKFKMICLNDNIPTLMAYANDISYEDVFVEQLKNFLEKDDLVIGISGSGNSKNVLKAIEYANKMGAITAGLTGYDGGALKKIAKNSVNVNINNMQITEDVHMIFDHMIMSILSAGSK